jgi:HD-like signal output (HDOD) protein
MQTTDLLERMDDLRLNDKTARRIHALWQKAAPFSQVERVVASDAVLASRLLKLANSSYYGSARSITSIRDALSRIGILSTRDLAWALALNALGADRTTFGPTLQHHGVEVAAASQLIARYVRSVPNSDAFVGGLLHDLGAQVLLVVEEQAYAAMLERYGFDDFRLVVAEKKTFGCDHATLTGLALERWGLPGTLVEAVSKHHTVRALNRGQRDRELALPAILHLAERMVSLCRQGESGEAVGAVLAADPVNAILGLQDEHFRIAAGVLPEEVAFVKEMLG